MKTSQPGMSFLQKTLQAARQSTTPQIQNPHQELEEYLAAPCEDIKTNVNPVHWWGVCSSLQVQFIQA